MKKVLYIFMSIILLASCQKDACVQTPEEAVVTFDVQTPVEFEVKSGENGTGSKINALWYGVYHKKGEDNYEYMSDMSAYVTVDNASEKISVPITLFKDQEYKIAFIAQYRSKEGVYTYILNDGQTVLSEDQFAEMVLNTAAAAKITDGEQLDAFVYWEKTGVIKHDNKKEITLSRPLAQINITTTATPKPATIDVKVTSEETQIANFTGLTCSGEHLATVYILPPASGKVTLDLTKYDANGQQIGTKNIPDVSVAKNFKTNIQGEI